MKNSSRNYIKEYLQRKFELDDNQLKFELDRYERNPDIGEELCLALQMGKPVNDSPVEVCVDGINYTAETLLQNYGARTIYATYSLLTQMREHPEFASQIIEGVKIK